VAVGFLAGVKLDHELAAFYQRSGFGEAAGVRAKVVPVYTGCLLVPLPNIEARRRFLKYHDLHHLVTGYSIGRIGEGEVSAWELGSGSAFVSPALGVMNLIALSTGLVLEPRRMWHSFRRGCMSRNLYPSTTRSEIESGRWNDVTALKQHCLLVRASSGPLLLRGAEFAAYGAAAMLIHAVIAVPAVAIRLVTDIGLGYSFFQAVKPRRRADLY
jgi:hypothetical protein